MINADIDADGIAEVISDHTSQHPAYTTGEVASLSSQHP